MNAAFRRYAPVVIVSDILDRVRGAADVVALACGRAKVVDTRDGLRDATRETVDALKLALRLAEGADVVAEQIQRGTSVT